jgi:Xaa-Pro aminopeptidase
VLLLLPKQQRGHRSVLFVEPNPGKTSDTFFTDRRKGELWVGPRLGVQQSRIRFGVDECRPLDELPDVLKRLKDVSIVSGLSSALERLFPKRSDRDVELSATLSELRLLKDKHEVSELSKAIASTRRAFEDVIAGLPEFRSEREVEVAFFKRARIEGNDTGYGTIAACGSHACILHWTHNDGMLRKSDSLLLDGGVEGHHLYTADITRTLPVSGTFSAVQREVYQAVYRAQRAAISAVKPGNDFMEPNKHAMRVLTKWLCDRGILNCSVEDALDPKTQFHKRYTLHNVSHMLGLDVHDCAKAREKNYRHGKLKPGMVLTIEPGLYFQPDDLTVPVKYRGIGIRIEDDVLVTPKGVQNLSRTIPSAPDDVEAWMRRVRSSRQMTPFRIKPPG